MKENNKYRVKCTPCNRKYGISCGNIDNAQDTRVWPKEIGTVVIYEGNGWLGMKLEFSRGRRIQIGTKYPDSRWEIDDDWLVNFIKVKS